MRRAPDLVLLQVLLLYLFAALVCAQDGFLSIDCGATEEYFDNRTLISWVTDDRYISTGLNVGSVNDSTLADSASFPQAASLRYFPNHRRKYCYSLPVHTDGTYLVRAGFFYGNYDQLNKPPVFGLTIETSFWTNVSFSDAPANAQEIIVRATRNTLDVCLVRFQDAPFISSLELRPLSDSMYTKVHDNCFLQKLIRVNCGVQPSVPRIRHPRDPYDRLWDAPHSVDGALRDASSNSTTFRTDFATDQPPAAVMSTAWVSNGKSSISVNLRPYSPLVSPNQTFYVAFFFGEVEVTNSSRIFNILLNDALFIGPLNLSSVAPDAALEARNSDFHWNGSSANFTLVPTEESGLGPLVNAIEIYSVSNEFNQATDLQDARALSALKNTFNLLDWTGDPCLPVPWDWVSCTSQLPPRIYQLNLSKMSLSGPIPIEITQLVELTDLFLNDNLLTGVIPDFSQLTHLRILHLEANKLEGTIPASLGNLTNLKELHLERNNLTGPIPQALVDKAAKGSLNYSGPGSSCLCSNEPAHCSCPSEGTDSGKGQSSGYIWGAVIGALLSFLALGLASITIARYCKRKSAPAPSLRGGERETSGRLLSLRNTLRASPDIHPQLLFSYKEVMVATNNFKRLLGEGRFGPSYYGQLLDGQEIAVKAMEAKEDQGYRDFSSEIELISRVRHKNLVRFIGYCREPERQYLIYEFMVEGTLRDHLVDGTTAPFSFTINEGKAEGPKAKKNPLDWRTRLDIALNAARGLEYLHTNAKETHRDVKSSNILLNARLMAKLGDFGISEISRNRNENFSHVAKIPRLSACYLDPEYYSSQQWTQKSDIYSFGVVLLELVCGREPINDKLPLDQRNIIEWVRPVVQAPNNMKNVVDAKLEGLYNSSAMWKVVRIANQCLELRSADRPTASQVVQDLMVAIDMESGIFHGLTDLSSDSSMERSIKVPLTLRSSQYSHRAGRKPSGDFTSLQFDLLESSAEHDLFSLSQSNFPLQSQISS